MSRAQKPKNTIIKDAVHQNGRTIITDVPKRMNGLKSIPRKGGKDPEAKPKVHFV